MSYRFRRNGTKFNNVKTVIDGITFDSKHEATRYCELKLLLRGGAISNLELQKKFILIPTQRAPDEVITLKSGKQKTIQGRLLERECSYLADFCYIDNETGKMVVEDTKSPITRTPEYKIKKKLMLERYGIQIKEI